MATLRLSLDIEPGVEPITGRLTGPHGQEREFCGWTALATTIDTAINPESSPTHGAEQESGPSPCGSVHLAAAITAMETDNGPAGRRFSPRLPAPTGSPTATPATRARRGARLCALAVAVVVAGVCTALVSGALVSGAQAHWNRSNPQPRATATGGPVPRFEPGPCPRTPEPIAALKTSRCGFLVVAENHARPDGRTIRLSVAIVPARAKSPKPDPVVFMTGGPGEAAVHLIPLLVDAGVNRDRNLIVMGQRGTLYDDPDLSCPELDRFYGRQVGLVWDAPSTGRLQAAAARTCHGRLVRSGADLSRYNTPENAADFADLRRALGISHWNVYGYSYGTDLALAYMRDYPAGIRTVTLDSVVPPDLVSLPWAWSSAREGITTVFSACTAQPRCARRFPNLLQTLTRVVKQLEAKPIVARVRPPQGGAPVKVVLDGGTILNMLVGNVVKFRVVPIAVYELAHGNPQRFLTARAAASFVPKVPEQALGMTSSFVCQEWVPYGSMSAVLRAGRAAFPTLPTSVLINAPQLPFEHELCRVWNVPKGTAAQRNRVRSNIPTLVISGTFDSRTGARWGRYAAATLPNSTSVRITGIGHLVIPQSACAQRIFQSFLTKPLSPQTACAAKTRPAPFTIG